MKNSKGIDPTKSIAEAYVAMNEVVTEAFSAYQNLSRRQKIRVLKLPLKLQLFPMRQIQLENRHLHRAPRINI